MCGFVSVISARGPIEVRKLTAMRDSLAHRGPDSVGLWAQEYFGFGQRRLAIVDPVPDSDQPMVSLDKRYVLNFNGEIYNYVELRHELEQSGAVFRTKSDTEVLLQALVIWGIGALPRLNGMFAFTLWDHQDRVLLMARDRFGEKPFFYHARRGYGLAAASEMKALLHDRDIPDDIDEEVLAAYQAGSYYEDGADTLFKHIKRLPPAHYAICDSKGAIRKIARYWTPDFTAIDHKVGRGEAVERFRHLLRESVRKRLRADVPIGSSLSGGLDSSALVGIISDFRARQEASATQNVFSARFDDDPTISEGTYIDRVVRHNGVKPFAVTPDPAMMLDEIGKLHWHQEEPFLSASIYLQWCVARLAKQNDTTVLLDGQGADELMGGYQFYYRNRQLDLLDTGRKFEGFRETFLFNSRLKRAALGYRDSARRFNAKVAYSLSDMVRLSRKEQPVYGSNYTVGVPPIKGGYRVRRQMAEALQYNALPQLLRYADRNSMAFSREARLPFLDADLVDFCISMPDDVFFKNGWQKYALRSGTYGYVPNSVRWRADKVGYAAPLDMWIRGSLKAWAHDRLFNGTASELPGFDRPGLERLWQEHQAGKQNHSWAFWRWISLSEWLDMRSEGRLRRSVA